MLAKFAEEKLSSFFQRKMKSFININVRVVCSPPVKTHIMKMLSKHKGVKIQACLQCFKTIHYFQNDYAPETFKM